MKPQEVPVGFAMALAQDPKAMQAFAVLSEDKKQEVIEGTHTVKTKEEMRQYVNNFAQNKQ